MWIKVDILSLLGKILENVATFSYMILKLAFLEEKGGLLRFKEIERIRPSEYSTA